MPIELKDVSYSYGKHEAVKHVTFTANRGDLVAVLGPNGAGKSTLFQCMLGLLRGYEGEIDICHKNIRTLSRAQLSRMAAYIPQSAEPVFNYTVFDTVLMGTTGGLGLLKTPGQAQTDAADAALRTLGIEELAQRGIGTLSGGERQLVLIARAMAQNAKILIMDEPTANLDYGNQQRVLERIRDLAAQGYTVLLSTHNPEHAFRYATHVLALQQGSAVACGKTQDTLTAELIEQLYGVKVKLTDTDPRTFVPIE